MRSVHRTQINTLSVLCINSKCYELIACLQAWCQYVYICTYFWTFFYAMEVDRILRSQPRFVNKFFNQKRLILTLTNSSQSMACIVQFEGGIPHDQLGSISHYLLCWIVTHLLSLKTSVKLCTCYSSSIVSDFQLLFPTDNCTHWGADVRRTIILYSSTGCQVMCLWSLS